MATGERKHLISVHTSTGTEAPSGASLVLGEIAVQHTPDNPALWIKMGTSEASDVYEKFIGETEIMTLISNGNILGSGYTYSGIPYVNSSTTIADAYSALTQEVLDDEETISRALNDLNDRVDVIEDDYLTSDDLTGITSDISGLRTSLSGLSGSVVSNAADIYELQVSSATQADMDALSAQTVTNTNDIAELSAATSEKEIFWVTMGETPYAEIISAYSENKFVVIDADGGRIPLVAIDEDEHVAIFGASVSAVVATISVDSNDDWDSGSFNLGELSAATVDIQQTVLDNSFVTAQALNALNEDIVELSGRTVEVETPFIPGDGQFSAVLSGSNGVAFGANSVVEGISVTNAITRGITTASTDDEIFTEWSGSTPDTDKFSLAKGEASHVEGNNNLAIGNHSHAEGNGCIAANNSSHAEGTGSMAFGKYAHAEGLETSAYGTRSHAEGQTTQANVIGSHAEGRDTIAGHVAENVSVWNSSTSYIKGNLAKDPDDGYVYVCIKDNTNKPLSNSTYWRREGYNHAEGRNTQAYDAGSHAEGIDTIADSIATHAEGYATWASGERSHAEGFQTQVYGNDSHVEGYQTKVYASYGAHAEGDNSIASANTAHAEGEQTKAFGINSHTEGFKTTTNGKASHAEGSGTTADGDTSHVEGINTIAYGAYGAHAEGDTTIASANTTHAEGEQTLALGVNSHVEGFKSKTGGNDTANTLSQDTHTDAGRNSHAEGNATIAQGHSSHSEGYKTFAKGIASHSEGRETVSSEWCSHAEGYRSKIDGSATANTLTPDGDNVAGEMAHAEGNASLAKGNAAHAEGKKTFAAGSNSHAEGNGTKAYGLNTHAEGNDTEASGMTSHAEGYGTFAYGECSHAEGSCSNAMGQTSHAEGEDTTASGQTSHAEGLSSTTIGTASHAEGLHTITLNFGEHAEGIYNASHFADNGELSSGNTIHSVGIGTAENARKNAFEIMQNGDAYLFGVGGYEGDAISGDVQTLQEVVGVIGSLSYKAATAAIVLDSTDNSTDVFVGPYRDNKANYLFTLENGNEPPTYMGLITDLPAGGNSFDLKGNIPPEIRYDKVICTNGDCYVRIYYHNIHSYNFTTTVTVTDILGNDVQILGSDTDLSVSQTLQGYYTKASIGGDIAGLSAATISLSAATVDIQQYIVNSAITKNDLVTSKAEFSAITETGKVVDAKVMYDVLEENENVTSLALNDLNTRVNTVSGDVSTLNSTVNSLSGSLTTVSGAVTSLSGMVAGKEDKLSVGYNGIRFLRINYLYGHSPFVALIHTMDGETDRSGVWMYNYDGFRAGTLLKLAEGSDNTVEWHWKDGQDSNNNPYYELTYGVNTAATAIFNVYVTIFGENLSESLSLITTGNTSILTGGSFIDDVKIQSIPSGGTTGQVLAKASSTDYDVEWTNGGGGATIITNDGSDGDSVAITLTDAGSYKRCFRIDIMADRSVSEVEQRIGSLIVECRYDADNIAHGYYYGDDIGGILSGAAIYQDDIETNTFYLMLTSESDNDSTTFAITPLDGGEVHAFITNADDDHTKADDVVITQVELTSNRVTSISSSSTNTEYPTAKAVYDLVGDIETLLSQI